MAALRGEFGEQLAACNAHRARQVQVQADTGTDRPADLLAVAEEPVTARDVQEGLVERNRLYERGEHLKDFVELPANLAVAAVPAGKYDSFRAAPARLAHRHRRADPARSRLIGARRHNPTCAGPADYDRQAAKARVVENLHRGKKGVHVDMQDVKAGAHGASRIRRNGSA